MNYSELVNTDYDSKMKLLGRLEADCKYFLGYGYGCEDRLWAKSKRVQIEYMYFIEHNYMGGNAYYMSNRLAQSMGVIVYTRREFLGKWQEKGITFEVYRMWGDEKGDRLECYTYPEGCEKKAKKFATSDRYMSVMDFLLYCQYNY